MSHAVIDSTGTVRKLDGPAKADQVITSRDVQDPEVLARLVQELRGEVATLRRAWSPGVIDFERVTTTGTSMSPQTLRFEHGFGGRVRYWPIGWESSGGVALALIEDTASTTANTLVLYCYSAGVLSLRVESAG